MKNQKMDEPERLMIILVICVIGLVLTIIGGLLL